MNQPIIPDYAHSPDEALARKRAGQQRNLKRAFFIVKIAIILWIVVLILKFFWPVNVEKLSDADAQQLLSMISPNLGNPDKMIVILTRDVHDFRESGLAVYCEYSTPPASFPTDPMKVQECQIGFRSQISLNNASSSNTIELSPPPDDSRGTVASASTLTGACAVSGQRAWFVFHWKNTLHNPFAFLEIYPAADARFHIGPTDVLVYRADYEKPKKP